VEVKPPHARAHLLVHSLLCSQHSLRTAESKQREGPQGFTGTRYKEQGTRYQIPGKTKAQPSNRFNVQEGSTADEASLERSDMQGRGAYTVDHPLVVCVPPVNLNKAASKQ